MASTKISDMTAATDLADASIPIVQGGVNKKASSSLLGFQSNGTFVLGDPAFTDSYLLYNDSADTFDAYVTNGVSEAQIYAAPGDVQILAGNGTLLLGGYSGSAGTFAGAQYQFDYSSNYTNRSLADKGYVDTAVSDARLKENITDIPESTPLIMALRPIEFDMKKDGEHKAGFIAQELQKVFPNMVVDDEGILKIKKDQIIPYLVKCVQELKAEIELLKAR